MCSHCKIRGKHINKVYFFSESFESLPLFFIG
nr:MAG TPA: hypothetical protein [Caudoviricetes sp.]